MDIEPIDNLEDLWKWKDRNDVAGQYYEELINFKNHDGPEVLLCHDMKGGYLPEEKKSGVCFEKDKYPYMFLNWWQIDIFNYFSHHFVTIPPEDYTRAAHKHGSEMLFVCKKILESEDTVTDTVDALVAIAKFYSFDGWLINIENVISPTRIDLLVKFCEQLTQKMRKINSNSRVIWYDSVLHSGTLLWQNCLNSNNCKFYEACDGIYLNYNWTDYHLLESADFGKLNRIFVGIDVWGRGCVGGFDCWKSFQTAKFFRMSVAIFAPGWIYEKFPDVNQITMGVRFWQKIQPYVKTRKLTNASFSTNFCTGMTISDDQENWDYQLSNVSIQPQCLSDKCYQVVGKGMELRGENQKFRIFSFDSIPFKRLTIEIQLDTASSPSWSLILNENQTKTPSISNSTFTFESGTLESIEIQTGDQQKLINITNLTIKCE